MIDWYLSLPRATWRHRLFAVLFAGVLLVNLISQWHNLHDDLAIARWVAWSMVAGVVIFMPAMLLILVCGRVPRGLARIPGSLNKTFPQIREDIEREHGERERNSRRF
jgi:cytochrome bd-type quinol oxidase subunit 1